jgi:hypothetical protein
MRYRKPVHLPSLVAVTIVVAIAITLIVIAAAAAAPACMTQAEARAMFPRAHLYWHTLHRCWDDRGLMTGLKNYRAPIDANANVASVGDIHWYPRPFGLAVEPIDPPVIVGVVEYRWPGSTVMDGPVTILEPITVVAAAEFNEIDERADH